MANVRNVSAERIRALEAENEELRRKLAALQDADERLQQQKNLLQTIFDHLPLMVNVASEGQIEIVNRAWERTLGLDGRRSGCRGHRIPDRGTLPRSPRTGTSPFIHPGRQGGMDGFQHPHTARPDD